MTVDQIYRNRIERIWSETSDFSERLLLLYKERREYKGLGCSNNDGNIEWLNEMIEETKLKSDHSRTKVRKFDFEWDSFEDRLNHNKWDKEGNAHLLRIYKKNGVPINKHIKDTDDDTDVVPYPISAKGISAFLADESITSFRYSFVQGGLNYGTGSQQFFKAYFNRRKLILRQNYNNSTPFEEERMLEPNLILEHLKEEQDLFQQSKLFYTEVIEGEKQTIETIEKASLKYPEWIKKTYLNEGLQGNESEQLSILNRNNEIYKPEEEMNNGDNDFLKSTIEDYLSDLKQNMTEVNYSNLTSLLYYYFKDGTITNLKNPITITGKINKKKIGWILNQLYRTEKEGILPLEYLLLSKNNISMFKNIDIDPNVYTKSNLYKYFTTKTQ